LDFEDERALKRLKENKEQHEFDLLRARKANEALQILEEINKLLKNRGYYIKDEYFGGNYLIKIDGDTEEEIALIRFNKNIKLNDISVLPILSSD
jgi:hypothetical protein